MRLYLAASIRQDAAERHARLMDARAAMHADGEDWTGYERGLRRAAGRSSAPERKVVRVAEPPKPAAGRGRGK